MCVVFRLLCSVGVLMSLRVVFMLLGISLCMCVVIVLLLMMMWLVFVLCSVLVLVCECVVVRMVRCRCLVRIVVVRLIDDVLLWISSVWLGCVLSLMVSVLYVVCSIFGMVFSVVYGSLLWNGIVCVIGMYVNFV